MAKRVPKVFKRMDLPERTLDITDTLGRIDFDDLRTEQENVGAQVIWYGVLTAAAKRRASQAELATRVVEARLDRDTRVKAKAMSEAKTEGAIKNEVRLHPDYTTVFETLFEREEEASVLESTKFALVAKQRMLEGLVAAQTAQAERLGRFGDAPTTQTGFRRPLRQPVGVTPTRKV